MWNVICLSQRRNPVENRSTSLLLRQPKLLLTLPRRVPHRILRAPGGLGRLPPSLARSLHRRIRRAFRRVGRSSLAALFRLRSRERRRGGLSGARGDLAQSARYAADGVAEAAAEGPDLDAENMSLVVL